MNPFEEISLLKNNWNDNGAKSFSKELVKKAESIFNNLYIKPFVYPTATNKIQFEYHKTNGEYLEFEISETNIELYIVDDTGKEFEKELINEQEVYKYVSYFYRENSK